VKFFRLLREEGFLSQTTREQMLIICCAGVQQHDPVAAAEYRAGRAQDWRESPPTATTLGS
jgi:hypothetical protein